MQHRTLLRALLLAGVAAGASAPLAGCLVAAVGAGATGGYALTQERSFTDTARDAGIHAVISQSWKKFDSKLNDDLDSTVYEGRVLLTGEVPSEDWRQEAVKRTWQVDGVKEVYDEIQVGPEEGFRSDMGDAAITSKLKAQLVGDLDVKSINYTVTTVNGVVYVIGSGRSKEEIQRVVDHARTIGNVRRVVSYVRIRAGEPPRAEASSAPPPGGPAPAAAAPPPPPAAPAPAAAETPDSAPTPRQSIEVTPLK